jgi:uncharacterized protein
MPEMVNPGTKAVPSGHRTLHLTPLEVWRAQQFLESYQPEAFEVDGFIHCTDDMDELMSVGNRFYGSDLRKYVALTINCDRVSVPVIYEDIDQKFPHIYGPLDIRAIERVRPVQRDSEGRFLAVED